MNYKIVRVIRTKYVMEFALHAQEPTQANHNDTTTFYVTV